MLTYFWRTILKFCYWLINNKICYGITFWQHSEILNLVAIHPAWHLKAISIKQVTCGPPTFPSNKSLGFPLTLQTWHLQALPSNTYLIACSSHKNYTWWLCHSYFKHDFWKTPSSHQTRHMMTHRFFQKILHLVAHPLSHQIRHFLFNGINCGKFYLQ